jgi:hypothetical protein
MGTVTFNEETKEVGRAFDYKGREVAKIYNKPGKDPYKAYDKNGNPVGDVIYDTTQDIVSFGNNIARVFDATGKEIGKVAIQSANTIDSIRKKTRDNINDELDKKTDYILKGSEKGNAEDNGLLKIVKYVFLSLFLCLLAVIILFLGFSNYTLISLLCILLFISIIWYMTCFIDKGKPQHTRKYTDNNSKTFYTYNSRMKYPYIIVGFILMSVLLSFLLPEFLGERKGVFNVIGKIFGILLLLLSIYFIVEIFRWFIPKLISSF